MEATYTPKPPDLIFLSQAPFSWTLRWAKKRREAQMKSVARTYKIEGSAANDEGLAAVIAFCELHGASLERA